MQGLALSILDTAEFPLMSIFANSPFVDNLSYSYIISYMSLLELGAGPDTYAVNVHNMEAYLGSRCHLLKHSEPKQAYASLSDRKQVSI